MKTILKTWPLYAWRSAKPLLTDFHLHSNYSPDGKNTIELLCEQALLLDFSAIAFTEHLEWHPMWHGDLNIRDYFDDISWIQDKYQPQGLTVYSGLEVGNPQDYPHEFNSMLQDYSFDIIIASQHWLNGANIHFESCFIGHHPETIYRQYFREIERMAFLCEFDILGHFDRIFWPGTLLGYSPNLKNLEQDIRAAMSALVRNDHALELNTRFLAYEDDWNYTIATILGWYFEEGGQHVLVNSDAHQTYQIGRNFDLAYQILENVKFDKLISSVDANFFEGNYLLCI